MLVSGSPQRVLVTGATGFVGRALIPALVREGHAVRATTRALSRARQGNGAEWVRADLAVAADVEAALTGIDAAYYLVHGMGGAHEGYRAAELEAATLFAAAAGRAGVKRIIYLGGVAPAGKASEHLASRLDVGGALRRGPVPTLELRASLVIGNGSASWKIVRDLAMRLPAMLLPKWTESKTSPIALEDVLVALTRGLRVPLTASAWFDVPGPEVLSGRDILLQIAALQGRQLPSLRVPLLSPSLSSWWLKLVTGVDFALARELVLGFTGDLLPRDDRYWSLIDHRPAVTFEKAARVALATEGPTPGVSGLFIDLEEAIVHRLGTPRR
ncbi:MAG: NAD(P)H-binding protein [Myxococcaceae bacterium]|nr:NAD(P)H-binding protein [Myxococcaceae bacterium]